MKHTHTPSVTEAPEHEGVNAEAKSGREVPDNGCPKANRKCLVFLAPEHETDRPDREEGALARLGLEVISK